MLLAIIMIFMDLRYPNTLSTFLGIDPLSQYDECVIRKYIHNCVICIKFRMSHRNYAVLGECVMFVVIDRKLSSGQCIA